jgi:hypothetical protein
MSGSTFTGSADRSWLQRPIRYDHVPLRRRRVGLTAIELTLMTAAILVIAFTLL